MEIKGKEKEEEGTNWNAQTNEMKKKHKCVHECIEQHRVLQFNKPYIIK